MRNALYANFIDIWTQQKHIGLPIHKTNFVVLLHSVDCSETLLYGINNTTCTTLTLVKQIYVFIFFCY